MLRALRRTPQLTSFPPFSKPADNDDHYMARNGSGSTLRLLNTMLRASRGLALLGNGVPRKRRAPSGTRAHDYSSPPPSLNTDLGVCLANAGQIRRSFTACGPTRPIMVNIGSMWAERRRAMPNSVTKLVNSAKIRRIGVQTWLLEQLFGNIWTTLGQLLINFAAPQMHRYVNFPGRRATDFSATMGRRQCLCHGPPRQCRRHNKSIEHPGG